MEDKLKCKTPFNGGLPELEAGLKWQTTYKERSYLMDVDLCWKITRNGRQQNGRRL